MKLRTFSKITCWSTLFLIFVGGMVTSTGSGLAVPDWPLSYGTLFPPMVGGVFYEHGHRMVASLVGLLILVQAVWMEFKLKRKWLKVLGYMALGVVIVQGLLGGITVLLFLPTPVSVAHGVLAQMFFILTIVIAYSMSRERKKALERTRLVNADFLRWTLIFAVTVYIQLILGALIRHTGSGLAIYDFPKMAGYWFPPFNAEMLLRINDWRFEQNLEYVSIQQVLIHFVHRLGALFIVLVLCVLNTLGIKYYRDSRKVFRTLMQINGLVFLQIILGIGTIHTMKNPIITSLHVVTGASILGLSVLLFLRTTPLNWRELKVILKS